MKTSAVLALCFGIASASPLAAGEKYKRGPQDLSRCERMHVMTIHQKKIIEFLQIDMTPCNAVEVPNETLQTCDEINKEINARKDDFEKHRDAAQMHRDALGSSETNLPSDVDQLDVCQILDLIGPQQYEKIRLLEGFGPCLSSNEKPNCPRVKALTKSIDGLYEAMEKKRGSPF